MKLLVDTLNSALLEALDVAKEPLALVGVIATLAVLLPLAMVREVVEAVAVPVTAEAPSCLICIGDRINSSRATASNIYIYIYYAQYQNVCLVYLPCICMTYYVSIIAQAG